jgi:predicted helicase
MMFMNLMDYITGLNQAFQHNNATEHTYRPALKMLIEAFDPLITATNEPARQRCGAPDFVLTKQQRPLGYIETKNIGKDLDSPEFQEQFERYRGALSNLIITDYLRFQFWHNSEKLYDISIGKIKNGKIVAVKENFAEFENVVKEFFRHRDKTITTSSELASAMAGKATLLTYIIAEVLNEPQEDMEDSPSLQIHCLVANFKEILIPNITNGEFADIYAQTIVYGLFVAGLYYRGDTPFTRKEARDSIPSLNPFLRQIFSDIADTRFDRRIVWCIDDLCELLGTVDFHAVMQNFGEANAENGEDPVIHFYEDFLAKYNPDVRKNRGVFYTPLPVVQYLVRAVDDILKEDFGISDGLADNSKVLIKQEKQNRETQKLQILDPATGTGTFLAEVIKHIYEHQKAKGQLGNWQKYVSKGLLPRLHGFEILMASDAIAHLKLDMILEGTGYHFDDHERLGIFLTNSLDEGKQEQIIGIPWLVEEANQANRVKRKVPAMVVIGNPPYNNFSPYNNGKWILTEIKEYKKGLGEKKINLDDDYIKFIRLAQHYIDKNGEGIVAYISNNGFLDGITYRQMRKSLLQSFDKIYIVNLHGNANIGETAPDGGKDENVFKIKSVGTCLYILVKLPKNKGNSDGTEVFHTDVYGTRREKFAWLGKRTLKNSGYKKLKLTDPYHFFVPKKFKDIKKYDKGFSVTELFLHFGAGIKTERDKIAISFTRENLIKIVRDFSTLPEHKITDKYSLYDSRDWTVARAKQDVQNHSDFGKYIQKIQYRPFDFRYIYYTGVSKGFVGTPGYQIARHLLRDNVGLIATRQFGGHKHFISFVTKTLIEISSQPYAPYTVFPLYLYNDIDDERSPNLSQNIVSKIAGIIGGTPLPEEVFDYVYAVLHRPLYREKYAEFLKIDFPKIPYPETTDEFVTFYVIGTKLRRLHLLETIPPIQTAFPIAGNNVVGKYRYHDGKIYINQEQYIDNVPQSAWEFFVGGYQPLQSYLKHRKGRELDIAHYQNMIAVLIETEKITKKMDTAP